VPGSDRNVRAIAQLAEPLRRRLYELVASRNKPVSRDEAAAEAGVGRTLAAYHLDRLAADGLLEATFAAPSARRGRGSGRPAKLYRRSREEFAVSVPARDYRLPAEVLAAAFDEHGDEAVRAAVQRAAGRLGREAAAGAASIEAALAAHGYEPAEDDDRTICLRNCPFHRLAAEHTDLVCSMNLAFVAGMLDRFGNSWTAALEPAPGRCCVAVHPDGEHARCSRRAPTRR
jgi:predicted ArsR family transcriptional regulator